MHPVGSSSPRWSWDRHGGPPPVDRGRSGVVRQDPLPPAGVVEVGSADVWTTSWLRFDTPLGPRSRPAEGTPSRDDQQVAGDEVVRSAAVHGLCVGASPGMVVETWTYHAVLPRPDRRAVRTRCPPTPLSPWPTRAPPAADGRSGSTTGCDAERLGLGLPDPPAAASACPRTGLALHTAAGAPAVVERRNVVGPVVWLADGQPDAGVGAGFRATPGPPAGSGLGRGSTRRSWTSDGPDTGGRRPRVGRAPLRCNG
jgi:hypothetical protein